MKYNTIERAEKEEMCHKIFIRVSVEVKGDRKGESIDVSSE